MKRMYFKKPTTTKTTKPTPNRPKNSCWQNNNVPTAQANTRRVLIGQSNQFGWPAAEHVIRHEPQRNEDNDINYSCHTERQSGPAKPPAQLQHTKSATKRAHGNATTLNTPA